VRSHPASTYFLLSRVKAEASALLARLAPAGLDFVHFGQSGADAVETALKLARLNGRRRVIAMTGGYHGLTLGALSISGHAEQRRAFEPLLDAVDFVPYGDAAALEAALRDGPEACVIVEPVQGEAGVIVPPDGYLRDVARACSAHGALLVLDEIQTGLGRLGAWWGCEREAVTPDILLVGKALSGGVVPVSAVVATAQAFRPLSRDPTLHASTFSGAPIAVAAAKAALEAIEAEDIVGRAARLGERLRSLVTRAVAETCPALVREVRCVGLLIAIEWEADHHALDFLIEMLDRRVIIALSSNAPRVARLTPPAILTDDDVETLDAALRASCTSLARR
jgi:putrescine aminotransferase